MKTVFSFLMLLMVMQTNVFAQNKMQKEIIKNNSVVMTWNKNTPEKEMNDDIQALKENNNVSIKYSNLKRNEKSEIVALKIEYADKEGNSGSQEYNNKNGIPEINFFKNNDEIGFGKPNSNIGMAFNDIDFNDLQNRISKTIKIDTLSNGSYNFNFNNEPKIQKKSKIMIQKDGRKPLVIEDGKVVEGQSEYSKEEIEKFERENKMESNNFRFNINPNDYDMSNMKDQMEKMQQQMQQLFPNYDNSQDKSNNGNVEKSTKKEKEDLTNEMKKAKEEMQKAKKEMEEARKELQKTKSEMKTQRI